MDLEFEAVESVKVGEDIAGPLLSKEARIFSGEREIKRWHSAGGSECVKEVGEGRVVLTRFVGQLTSETNVTRVFSSVLISRRKGRIMERRLGVSSHLVASPEPLGALELPAGSK